MDSYGEFAWTDDSLLPLANDCLVVSKQLDNISKYVGLCLSYSKCLSFLTICHCSIFYMNITKSVRMFTGKVASDVIRTHDATNRVKPSNKMSRLIK